MNKRLVGLITGISISALILTSGCLNPIDYKIYQIKQQQKEQYRDLKKLEKKLEKSDADFYIQEGKIIEANKRMSGSCDYKE